MSANPYNVATVRCAGPNCDAIRREANHWFVLSVNLAGQWTRPYEAGVALRPDDKPVCGERCAIALYQQYLSSAKQVSSGGNVSFENGRAKTSVSAGEQIDGKEETSIGRTNGRERG